MRVLFTDTFRKSLAALDDRARGAVKRAVFDFQLAPASPGFRLHRLVHARDAGFWSLRADRDVRIIVHRGASALAFCYADRHDKAYAWAEQRRFADPAGDVFEIALDGGESAAVSSCVAVPRPATSRGAPRPRRADERACPVTPAEREASPAERRMRVHRRAVAPLPAGDAGGSGTLAPLADLLRLASRSGWRGRRSAAASAAPGEGGGAAAVEPEEPSAPSPARRRTAWPLAVCAAADALALALVCCAPGGSHEVGLFAAGAAAALAATAASLVKRRAARDASALLREVTLARDALREGRLDVRADASLVGHALEPVAACVNEVIDAVAEPFRQTTAELVRLSAGEIPEVPQEARSGELARQREAIGALVSFMQLRAEDIRRIVGTWTDAVPQ